MTAKKRAKRKGGGLRLLVGDPYLVRQRLESLQKEVLGESTDFGAVEVLHGDRADLEEIATAVRTLPFMGSRFVVLRSAERMKEEVQKGVTALLEEIPPTTHFVVVSESPDMRKKFFASLKKLGEVETLGAGSKRDGSRSRGELLDLARNLAKERGVVMQGQGLAVFADFIQDDIGRMVNELEKLALRYGKEPVEPRQVVESLGGERALIAFALEGALRERKIGRAIAELRRALSRGERGEVLVGQMAGELRSLLRARALLDAGLDEASAIRAFGGGRGYFVVPRARNFRRGELVRALRALGRVDVGIKTGSMDPGAGLERVLLQLNPST